MRYFVFKSLFLLLMGMAIASCSSSKKQPGSSGRVIIREDGRNARVGGIKKDNGLHKGWYKNPNNPHHPNTTNPGHTKKQAVGHPKKKGPGNSKKHPGKSKGKKW
ncbi:hypothetical protein [Pontibacter beigongshangensis]|uniref:hypothetical protein n=1 Tax=Pontibacter beigongshangensis TaxID=2574733 RepID=UPI001F5140DC|nr:hypothetical protein [Pontibacter beigongshangensis]